MMNIPAQKLMSVDESVSEKPFLFDSEGVIITTMIITKTNAVNTFVKVSMDAEYVVFIRIY